MIKLIVGLGNPGKEYEQTRHNVGFWLVEELARQQGVDFKTEPKFLGSICKISLANNPVWLLKPNTYMNRSGQAIQKLASFYKIEAEQILVVHDELDMPPGSAKLKKSGGHGGHNGLRDTISQMHSKDFFRLRIGIGHPGHKSQVSNYVLHAASKTEQQMINDSIDNALGVIDWVVDGDIDKAMNNLHSKN